MLSQHPLVVYMFTHAPEAFKALTIMFNVYRRIASLAWEGIFSFVKWKNNPEKKRQER